MLKIIYIIHSSVTYKVQVSNLDIEYSGVRAQACDIQVFSHTTQTALIQMS